jgi:hypothetical protein
MVRSWAIRMLFTRRSCAVRNCLSTRPLACGECAGTHTIPTPAGPVQSGSAAFQADPVLPAALFVGRDRYLEHPLLIRTKRPAAGRTSAGNPTINPFRGAVVAHEAGEPSAGSVVDHGNQIDGFATPFQPVMYAGVPLHQLAAPVAPSTPLVHLLHPAPPGFSQSRFPHPRTERLLADGDLVLLPQILRRRRRAKPPVHRIAKE